jgi:hypothetical protein
MVLVFMYLMYPVAYPTAMLLDYFLGESHGTVYKKAGKDGGGGCCLYSAIIGDTNPPLFFLD